MPAVLSEEQQAYLEQVGTWQQIAYSSEQKRDRPAMHLWRLHP